MVFLAAVVTALAKGYGTIRGIRIELRALSDSVSSGRSPVEGRRTARTFAARRSLPSWRMASSTPRRHSQPPPIEYEMSRMDCSDLESNADEMAARALSPPRRPPPPPPPREQVAQEPV
jgi:hypothetical protein